MFVGVPFIRFMAKSLAFIKDEGFYQRILNSSNGCY